MLAAEGLLEQLVAGRVLYPSGVPGVLGRSGAFEDVIARFEALALRIGDADDVEHVHFPPTMSRNQFETSGYLKNFPHLAGTVHCFCGNDHDHAKLLSRLSAGDDWTLDQKAADVVLTPAACYPIYPIIGARGPLPPNGATIALSSYCFRHEPSDDPARMQSFRQREFVRIGTPQQIATFRQFWMDRSVEIAKSLRLPAELDVANDPFFGRGGKVIASSQREQALKFEVLIPVSSDQKLTACMSINYHQDHFGQINGITNADGSTAHTACIGFGLERLALAMFRHHGLDPKAWPADVRAVLWG